MFFPFSYIYFFRSIAAVAVVVIIVNIVVVVVVVVRCVAFSWNNHASGSERQTQQAETKRGVTGGRARRAGCKWGWAGKPQVAVFGFQVRADATTVVVVDQILQCSSSLHKATASRERVLNRGWEEGDGG